MSIHVFQGNPQEAIDARQAALQQQELHGQTLELNRMRLSDAVAERNAKLAEQQKAQQAEQLWADTVKRYVDPETGQPDYDSAITELYTQAPDLAETKHQELLKHRSMLVDARKKELDADKLEMDVDLETMKRMVDPHAFEVLRPRLSQHAQQLVGDQHDPARIQQLIEAGSKDVSNTEQSRALLDKDLRGFMLKGLLDANDPDAVKDISDGLVAMYGPKQAKAFLGVVGDPLTPEGKERIQQIMQQAPEKAVNQQAKEFMVDGKPVMGTFDPASGKYFVGGQDVTTKAKPIPPSSSSGGVGGAQGLLTPGAIQRAGAAYRLLGAPSIPTRIGEADRAKIMNESDKQATALGQSPVATIQRQLALKADGPALALVRKQEAGTVAAESKALKQIDLIKSISPNVPRTDWNFVNSGVQAFREQTGNTPAIKLANAIITFASEYGKIIEGSTGSVAGASDSARAAAAKLVNASQSQKTLNEVVEQMKLEMGYAKEGWHASADAILNRMGGGEGSTTDTPKKLTAEELIKKYGGK